MKINKKSTKFGFWSDKNINMMIIRLDKYDKEIIIKLTSPYFSTII